MHAAPETLWALTGGSAFTGETLLAGHAVIIRGERVHTLEQEEKLDPAIRKISVAGSVIAPGFVDLQLNGCGGVLFNDAITPQTLRTMHATNLKTGCTAFLPTLITTTEDDMRKAMAVTEEFRKGTRACAAVPGLHLEGPYINKKRKGIHDAAQIKTLTRPMREDLARFAQKTPLMLTLAPECVEAKDISFLTEAGVIVSLGHSAASYEEAMQGIRAGAKAATHLFNGMVPFTAREPGIVGAALSSPTIACGLIADGHHVHFAALALVKRLKGEMCFLVTDATAPVGTDMTEFIFGGQTVYVRNDMCVNADGTLGGSLLTMMKAVENCATHMGVSLEETLRMAALYPARLMGRETDLGRIAPGSHANLAVFNPETFAMTATVDSGELHLWEG